MIVDKTEKMKPPSFPMIPEKDGRFKQGAKLQQARLIGASDAVNRGREALAPVGVGGGF